MLVACILLGACVGSFLNVVIYRLPRQAFFSMGRRSVCPACSVPIRWYDNIPVISWVVLGGQARCCGAAISVRYLLVELLTAFLFGLLYSTSQYQIVVEAIPVGGRFGPLALDLYPGAVGYLFQAAFVALLVACTFIDIDHRILPDALDKPGMVLGIVGSAVVPGLAGTFHSLELPLWINSTLYSVVGLTCGVALTWGIRIGARAVFRKEAMGFGDVKFMGMIGAFVGWEGAVMTFFLGSMFGAVGGLAHRLVTGDLYVPFVMRYNGIKTHIFQ